MVDPESTKILRLLDANANRAREALRVLEDYTRFVLDDSALSLELKTLRHDLAAATQPWLAEAIVYRDTSGDVGTRISTDAEMHREGLADVIIAAGKRLGEALRTLEEFAKTLGTARGQQFESVRYRFYALEQTIMQTLRPAALFNAVRLYVLITESACKADWYTTAQAAIRGGADALQLREKHLESGELLSRARRLAELCHRSNVRLIINDRPDIASLSNADGVHVGQGDVPAVEARKLVGHRKIVGVSTHNISQAKQAVADGADYIGAGPVFRSGTKPRDWTEIPGVDYARLAANEITVPVAAIAGITFENVAQVLQAGVQCVAVTAAITGADDVETSARRMKALLSGAN